MRGLGTRLTSPDQLEQSLSDLERIDPRNPVAENIRCETLKGENRDEEIITRTDGLLARDDLTPAARGWALRNRAATKSRMGDKEGALADIKEATSLDPTNHFNFKVLGVILTNMGGQDAAIVSLRQSLALTPGDVGSQRSLATLLGTKGKWQEAAAVWASICDTRNVAAECAMYAYDLFKAGDRTGAYEAAKRAMVLLEDPKQDPKQDLAGGTYNLACLWALAGERSQALQFLNRSLSLAPQDPKAILDDADLNSLHSDPEFQAIVAHSAERYQKK